MWISPGEAVAAEVVVQDGHVADAVRLREGKIA